LGIAEDGTIEARSDIFGEMRGRIGWALGRGGGGGRLVPAGFHAFYGHLRHYPHSIPPQPGAQPEKWCLASGGRRFARNCSDYSADSVNYTLQWVLEIEGWLHEAIC
jgi:hypothetical protein